LTLRRRGATMISFGGTGSNRPSLECDDAVTASSDDRGCGCRLGRRRGHRLPGHQRRGERPGDDPCLGPEGHRSAGVPAQPLGRLAVARHGAHDGHRGATPDPAVGGDAAGGCAGGAGRAGLRHRGVQRRHPPAAGSPPGRADQQAPRRRRDRGVAAPVPAAAAVLPARRGAAGDGRLAAPPRSAADRRLRDGREARYRARAAARPPAARTLRRPAAPAPSSASPRRWPMP